MSYIRFDDTLRDFVGKDIESQRKVVRKLSPSEFELSQILRKTAKKMNTPIIELITMIRILNELNDSDLKCICNNLHKTIHSLKIQREFCERVRYAFLYIKPNAEELTAIEHLIKRIEERIRFIQVTVVSGNIELTPIQDYLELINAESFIDDLYVWFQTPIGMVLAGNSDDSDLISEYAKHILNTVKSAGRLNDYEDRLGAYVVKTSKEVKAKKADKHEENRAPAKSELALFSNKFYYCASRFESNSLIGVNSIGLQRKLNLVGRNNFYIICVYFCKGLPRYAYLSENGTNMTHNFAGARPFKTKEKVEEAIEFLADKYPDRAFDYVTL